MAFGSLQQCLAIAIALLSLAEAGNGLRQGENFVVSDSSRTVYVTRKDSLLLYCTIAKNIRPLVTGMAWRKDGQSFFPWRHKHIESLDDGSFNITKIKHKKGGFSDAGSYRCIAKNEYGIIYGSETHVRIAKLSRVSRVSNKATVSTAVKGETVRFTCPVKGEPWPEFQWSKDGKKLSKSYPRYIQLDTGVLQILNVSTSDSGSYQCSARNIARKRTWKDHKLTVTEDAASSVELKLLSGPANATKLGDTTTVLECAVNGLPSPIVEWTRKDGLPIPPERSKRLGNNLQIEYLRPEDSGVYICTGTQPDNANTVSAQGNLTVHVPPKLEEAPLNHESVVSARTVRFTCAFSGVPKPEIEWMKNGTLVTPKGRIMVRKNDKSPMQSNSTLIISQSTADDTGYYHCVSSNAAGSARMVARATVVQMRNSPTAPKELRAQPIDHQSVLVTGKLSPIPPQLVGVSIHYYLTSGDNKKEKQTVIGAQDLENANWSKVLDNLQANSNYTFYVVAYAEAGSSPHSEYVTVKTKSTVPSVAPVVKLNALGPTTIQVEWSLLKPAEARGDITGYKLFWTEAHHSNTVRKEELTAGGQRYILQGLKPGTAYSVRVLARTVAGYPNPSDIEFPWVTENTLDNDQGLQVNAKALNTSAIEVTWSIPSNQAQPSNIFITYHKQEAQDSEKVLNLSGVTTHYTVGGLKPNTLYDFRVTAVRSTGKRDTTNFFIKTERGKGPSGPPPAPLNVECLPINSTAIKVKWELPLKYSQISSYLLKYRPTSPTDTEESTDHELVKVKMLEAVIKNLKQNHEYSVQVMSYADANYGQYTKEVICKTLEGKPGPPRYLSVVVLDEHNVQMLWKAPAEPNGKILGYSITYTRGASGDEELFTQNINATSSERENVKIPNLKTNEQYNFKVQAFTSAGHGPFTNVNSIVVQPSQHSPVVEGERGLSDKTIGIIIGASIGVLCIIICIIIINLRNRQLRHQNEHPPRPAYQLQRLENGFLIKANGQCIPGTDGVPLSLNRNDIDTFIPMMVASNDGSEPQEHCVLVTRNGEVKGILVPQHRICTDYLPNGHVVTRVANEAPDQAQIPLMNNSEEPQAELGDSLEDIDRSVSHESSEYQLDGAQTYMYPSLTRSEREGKQAAPVAQPAYKMKHASSQCGSQGSAPDANSQQCPSDTDGPHGCTDDKGANTGGSGGSDVAPLSNTLPQAATDLSRPVDEHVGDRMNSTTKPHSWGEGDQSIDHSSRSPDTVVA